MSRSLCFSALYDEDDSAPSTPVPVPAPSSAPMPLVYRCWVLFEDIENDNAPCRCCSATQAMECNGDVWACYKSERAWLILDTPPDMSLPHELELCDGHNCRYHPLHYPELASFTQAVTSGMKWGDLLYEDDMAALAKETPAQKAAREAKSLREDRERQLACEAARMQKEAEMVEFRSKMGLKRGEAPRKASIPCKKLYSCCGDKKTGGAKPTTLHVSSECWAWEYTDPRDGRIKAPRTCPWLHPGEEGWHAEWMKDRTWKDPTGTADAPSWRASLPPRGVATPNPTPKPNSNPSRVSFAAGGGGKADHDGWENPNAGKRGRRR